MNNKKIFKWNSHYKLLLILFLLSGTVNAQHSKVFWYSFSAEFGEASSQETKLKSSVGIQFFGRSTNNSTSILSGFFANPNIYGLLTDIKNQPNVQLPTSFELKQNYPNPFNPSTNIKFALPKQSSVKIIIYDILGRNIKTLINEAKPAGIYTIQWNGKNESNIQASSGVYFYVLLAVGTDNDKFTMIKKMILLK